MRRGALEARQLRSPGYKRAGTVSRSTGRPVKCDAGCGGQVTGVARGRSSTYARHDKVRRRTYGCLLTMVREGAGVPRTVTFFTRPEIYVNGMTDAGVTNWLLAIIPPQLLRERVADPDARSPHAPRSWLAWASGRELRAPLKRRHRVTSRFMSEQVERS